MSVSIRPYVQADIEDLIEIWAAASERAHPFLKRDFLESEEKNIRELYVKVAETWMAEVDDRAVGFLALIGNEVGAIFVRPEEHRRGIGHALMEHARTRHETLEVEVFERNEIGRGFYAREGFTPLRESVHEPTGEALLRLRWTPPR